MKFEWDINKNEINIQKHGIDFKIVPEIFEDLMLVKQDNRKDYGEKRYIGIGFLKREIAVVIFVMRDPDIIRIISARRANKNEKKEFTKNFEN